MDGDSLHREICAAARGLEVHQAAFDWLLGKGLREDATGGAEVGLERVRFHGGLYEPDESGQLAFIQPVPGHVGLIDLVAWLPSGRSADLGRGPTPD